MELLVAYLICELEDKMTEHVLLRYSQTYLIWEMAGGQLWSTLTTSWLPSFLDMIRHCTMEG